jgi:3-deoxy-D-arabino-heptulosonate 7-phosphate (DAHP) synthase
MHFDKGTRNTMELSTVGFLRAITLVINTAHSQERKPKKF